MRESYPPIFVDGLASCGCCEQFAGLSIAHRSLRTWNSFGSQGGPPSQNTEQHLRPLFLVRTKKRFWGYPEQLIQISCRLNPRPFWAASGRFGPSQRRFGAVVALFEALRDPHSRICFCLNFFFVRTRKKVSFEGVSLLGCLFV